MPISSEIKKAVPRKAPEGLIGRAIQMGMLERGTLVYELEWVRDESLEAMLEERERKTKAVRVTCSECGQSVILPYVPQVSHYGCRGTAWKTGYGFLTNFEYGGEAVGSGDEVSCPVCEAGCVAKKAAEIGRGRFVSDEGQIMSACLAELPDENGKKPLALIGWRVRREANRLGNDHYTAEPLDAYVFDGRDAAKLTGSYMGYGGAEGYFLQIKSAWDMPQQWTCDWDKATEIFGLTPEMIAGSTVENCKLDEYMAGDGIRMRERWPIAYMRLWQQHPQAENLVHQGAGHILDALFDKHGARAEWRQNKKGRMELPELDWSEVRPAQILRLDKDEWRAMRTMSWDFYHWDIFVKAKLLGDRLALPEDITNLHRYGGEDVEEILGRAPLGKSLRYLLRQYEMYGETEETDPEEVIGDDIFGARELADYWRMAEACGWDLGDPAVRWPRELMAAHDRAAQTYELQKEAIQKKAFASRYRELRKYEYASGELLIRPARSMKELKDEGAALSHCVGSYGNAHLNGGPIFFVRRATAPRTPWYTLQLNLKELKVVQNRGKYNCARTEEVQAFENEWIAWVRAGARRKKDGTPVGAKPQAKKARKRKEKAA